MIERTDLSQIQSQANGTRALPGGFGASKAKIVHAPRSGPDTPVRNAHRESGQPTSSSQVHGGKNSIARQTDKDQSSTHLVRLTNNMADDSTNAHSEDQSRPQFHDVQIPARQVESQGIERQPHKQQQGTAQGLQHLQESRLLLERNPVSNQSSVPQNHQPTAKVPTMHTTEVYDYGERQVHIIERAQPVATQRHVDLNTVMRTAQIPRQSDQVGQHNSLGQHSQYRNPVQHDGSGITYRQNRPDVRHDLDVEPTERASSPIQDIGTQSGNLVTNEDSDEYNLDEFMHNPSAYAAVDENDMVLGEMPVDEFAGQEVCHSPYV
jgi:hypothetical protein